jgi:5'-3' exonuclease
MASLLLIDLSGIFWACWHASANEELSAAYGKTLGNVAKLISDEKADHVAIACDFAPYKRKELLPSYKANREAAPPLATEQLRKVEQRLRDDGLTVWSVPGYEADDVIATAVAEARKLALFVVVASSDKDLLQLVAADGVVVRAPQQRYSTPTEVEERWGIGPEHIGDMLALAGDKSDNIPGIEKCGPVTAAKWLKQYGSLDGVISHAAELGRFADAVAQRADEIRLWRQVVELDARAPIDFQELFQIKEKKPLVTPDYNDGFEAGGEIDPGPDKIVVPASVELPKLEMPPTQAIEVARPQAIERAEGMQPRSLDAAWKFSNAVFNSRLYPRFNTREQVFTVMVRGSEMGLGALTALDCFHMVEGRPTMHAHLIIARAMAHPDCEYFQCTETSAERATYVTKSKRNPQPTTLTYTIADAKAAGVCPQNPREKPALNDKGRDSRGQWEKRPAEMLRKTAGVQLARVVYPAASIGLYATEELSDDD